MERESKSGSSGLSGNGMVAVFLVAAGALVMRVAPLEGTRPAANEAKVEQRYAEQDIDARLWQDPFGAVARAREDAAKKLNADQLREDEKRHSDRNLAADIARTAQEGVDEITVLSVMLPGGPYAEYVESRRRTRYAVLAGLNASKFAPIDTEHLGYFLPSGNDQRPRALPEAVPYEWFESDPDGGSATVKEAPRKRQVLVLWLDNSAFYFTPFVRFKRLFASLRPDGAKPTMRWQVLGPVGSDGLRVMIEEAAARDFNKELFSGMEVRFKSFSATVSDQTLLEPLVRDGLAKEGQSLSEFLRLKGIALLRTIGDDKQLSSSLTDELVLRGLKARASGMVSGADPTARDKAYREMCRVEGAQDPRSPSHIAIVAEWDTLYGRSMRRNFRIDAVDDKGFCIDRYSYVRGLDGQLPERGSNPNPTSGTGKEAASGKDDSRRQDGSFIERAEGQSQFDYLRRLAGRLHEKDEKLRLANFDGSGLRAIGVLGNDVHDKLLVMQALRPEFPNTIFFTTDLDARFLHPREQAWARNLIVASTFGLRLNDGLQAGTPPFRDSYQTAAFLATLLAFAKDDAVPPMANEGWLAQPRVFEIGRSVPFDFSAPASSASQDPTVRCRVSELKNCTDIHPPPSPGYPHLSTTAGVLSTSALLLLLWLPALTLSRRLRRRLRRYAAGGGVPAVRWRRRVGLAAAVLVLQVVVPLLLLRVGPWWTKLAGWLTQGGKPISFSEGLSIWPTEVVHLMTVALCIYLVFRAWTALTLNLDQISHELRLGRSRRQLLAEQEAQERSLAWWQKVVNMFSLHAIYVGTLVGEPASDRRMTPETLRFWKLYIAQNRPSSRFMRTVVCVLVVMAAFALLLFSLAESVGVPRRGELSAWIHWNLGLVALFVMSFLVFWVADATLFCVRFVHALRIHRANWPERTLNFFEARIGALPPPVLDHWIDLQCVAHRTRCVTGLIYYPFIVLSLLLVSRSSVFDNWQLPAAVLVMVLLSVGVVLACAVALRRAAEKSREKALDDVHDALLLANAGGGGCAAQLDLLRRRIEGLNEGAFAPFSQQPLLKAVLLPFATLGGTTLLDYLALANV